VSRKKNREARIVARKEYLEKQPKHTCEFATRPFDASSVCGAPATHAIIDPCDPVGPFRVCDEHWTVMLNDMSTNEPIEIGSPEWKTKTEDLELETFLKCGPDAVKRSVKWRDEYEARAKRLYEEKNQ
jgi:hypothetical protein